MSEINPWEHPELSKIWKTQSSFMGYIRGCIRKAWNRHPAKLITIKNERKRIPNPNPKGKVAEVWGFDCPLCKETFVQSEGNVDHINPAGTLTCKEDIQGFVERLLWVTPEDLRLICKGCNSALALAGKKGITYEEAVIEKEVIKIIKEKRDKKVLLEYGIEPESSQAKRRQQLVELLTKENIK